MGAVAMVTIYDIAKACDVSVATVSKSLNDLSGVSKKTKERVKETAKQMNYFPNSQARTLATHKSNNIGVLFTDDTQRGLSHQFFSVILEKLRYEVENKGYDLCFVAVNSSEFADSYYRHCMYKSIDGVVIVSIDFDEPKSVELIHGEIPIVLIDKIVDKKTSVVSDNYGGTKAMVQYLAKCGHKRIGYVHGQEVSNSVTERRMSGFISGMEENKLEIHEEWLKEGKYYNREKCYDRVKELLVLENRPTVILLSDDYSALGAYAAARDLGMNIPEDISFVGHDGVEIGEFMTPKLTTIYQNAESIGENAGKQIVRLIESGAPKPHIKKIDTELRVRASVKVFN